MPIASQPRSTRGHTGTREEAHRHEDRCAEADRLRHEHTHGTETQEHSPPWQPSTRWFPHTLPSSIKTGHMYTQPHTRISTQTQTSHTGNTEHTRACSDTHRTHKTHTHRSPYTDMRGHNSRSSQTPCPALYAHGRVTYMKTFRAKDTRADTPCAHTVTHTCIQRACWPA